MPSAGENLARLGGCTEGARTKRRGNPGKLPDDDTVAHIVRIRELVHGEEHADAVREVAERLK
jgi:hypothetical protein